MLLRHGRGPQGQAHPVHAAGNGRHHGGTEGDVSQMSHVEHHAQARLDACHVVGCKLAQTIAHLGIVHIHLTNQVRQLARINLHGARRGAEAVGGTGLVAIILILFLQRGQSLRVSTRGGKIAYLTLYGDTHTTG